MYILRWVVSDELDLRSLEQCSLISRGFYLCARDSCLWKSACIRSLSPLPPHPISIPLKTWTKSPWSWQTNIAWFKIKLKFIETDTKHDRFLDVLFMVFRQNVEEWTNYSLIKLRLLARHVYKSPSNWHEWLLYWRNEILQTRGTILSGSKL